MSFKQTWWSPWPLPQYDSRTLISRQTLCLCFYFKHIQNHEGLYDPHLAAPLFSRRLTPLKDFMHEKWRQKEMRALKVFRGAVMAGTQRKEEEWQIRSTEDKEGWMEVGAQSSIIEENLAAADRTMGSFCPATVGSFLVNSISQGFRWRSESLSVVEILCPSSHKSCCIVTLCAKA